VRANVGDCISVKVRNDITGRRIGLSTQGLVQLDVTASDGTRVGNNRRARSGRHNKITGANLLSGGRALESQLSPTYARGGTANFADALMCRVCTSSSRRCRSLGISAAGTNRQQA